MVSKPATKKAVTKTDKKVKKSLEKTKGAKSKKKETLKAGASKKVKKDAGSQKKETLKAGASKKVEKGAGSKKKETLKKGASKKVEKGAGSKKKETLKKGASKKVDKDAGSKKKDTLKKSTSSQKVDTPKKGAGSTKKTLQKGAGKKTDASQNASSTASKKVNDTKKVMKAIVKTAPSVLQSTSQAVVPAAPGPAQASDVKMVTKILKGSKIPVDDLVPLGDSYSVYVDAECTWACMLNQSNVGANNNKFYVIQLLTRNGAYQVWTRWGRVGVPGQSNMAPCSSVGGAKATFMSKFQAKTGFNWGQRQLATPRAGRYAFIEMDYDVDDDDITHDKGPISASKLHPKVQNLVKLICDVDMMKKSLIEVGYDAKKMPLGKISPAMVSAGFTKLQEISSELKGANRQNELERLTGEFFTVVPHDIGFKKMSEFTINTQGKLKDKILMVESLKEIEVAHKLLASKGSKEANPVDTHYENLKCGLTPLARGSNEWDMVETYATNTCGKTHSIKLTLKNLFAVDKPDGGKFKKFEGTHNRQLLWHGSRLTNWVGILGQGLRIAPPEAPVTGYMFGKGVYFADCVSKSANYCCAYSSGNRGLLLLCDVALGNMNELKHSDFNANKLPPGMLSTKGLGQYEPQTHMTSSDGVIIPYGKIAASRPATSLLYNEYIVYDTAQIRPKYLCEFDFN